MHVYINELGCYSFLCQNICNHHGDISLQWRNDGRDGVSRHRRLDCLFNRLFRCWSKKTSKVRVTGLCEVNPPVTGGFPSRQDSDAEKVFIWWRHHVPIGAFQGTPTQWIQITEMSYKFSIEFIALTDIFLHHVWCNYLSITYSQLNRVGKTAPGKTNPFHQVYLKYLAWTNKSRWV